MTELSFLIDLLLNHKLPKSTQQAIKARIDEIQTVQITPNPVQAKTFAVRPIPSVNSSVENVNPVTEIAQTPAAHAALAQRQAMIDAAVNRKVAPGTDHAPKVHGRL